MMMKIHILLSLFLFLQSPYLSSSTGTPTHSFYTPVNTGTNHQAGNQVIWSPIEPKKEDGLSIIQHNPHHQSLIQPFSGNAPTSTADNSYVLSEPKSQSNLYVTSGSGRTGGGENIFKSYSGPSGGGDHVETEALVQFYQRPIGYEITSEKGVPQYGGDQRGGIDPSFTGGETFPPSSHGDLRAKPVNEDNSFHDGYSHFQAQKQNQEASSNDPNKNFEDFEGFGIDEDDGDFRQDFSEDYNDGSKDYNHNHHHQTREHENNLHANPEHNTNNNQRNHGTHSEHHENEYTEPSNSFYDYASQDYREEVSENSGPSAKSPVKFNPYGGFQVYGSPSDSSFEHEDYNKSPSSRENYNDHPNQHDFYNGPEGTPSNGQTRDVIPTLSERMYDDNPSGMKYKHISTRDASNPLRAYNSFINP
ncbi:uncharacterized protein [Lepeophtheirus salmonis]|uniref:uncharacterized protein n=1 Tax=Lepeophtheirus salmonis TaxID=72036 RepID=UPI001AEA55B2|nr:probable serine/threonine-protein kinase clkA [Lepeophtheirus salmonis]